MSTASPFQNLLLAWDSYDPDELSEQINQALGSADAGWEFGPSPDDDARMRFSLSLRNDPDWMGSECKRLGIPFQSETLEAALGIPPRDWDRYFEAVDRDNKVQQIDGHSWMFKLTPADDPSMVHLGVFADLPDTLDWFETVSVMLTGELGEQNVSDRIAQIDRLGDTAGLAPLSHLRSEFVQLFPNCPFRAALTG